MNVSRSLRLASAWLKRGPNEARGTVATEDPAFIDYRDMAARYTFAEHAARADKYFATRRCRLSYRAQAVRGPLRGR